MSSEIEQMYRAKYDLDNVDYIEPEPRKNHVEAILRENTPMTEDQLILDELFQEQASIMYEKTFEAERERLRTQDYTGFRSIGFESSKLDDPIDMAEWAVNHVAWFRNNATSMMVNLAKLSRSDPDLVVAFNNVNTMYSQTPNTGKQFVRGTGQAVLDPVNLLGISAIAKTATAGTAGKQLASTQLNRYAQRIMQNRAARMAATGGVASVEGAAFAGGVTYGEERLNEMATGQEVDSTKVGVTAGVGAVLGPTFVGGAYLGHKAYKGTKRLIQNFRVKRGEGAYGGNSFTDSDVVAQSYADQHENGSVREVEIAAKYPAYLSDENVTGSQLSDELDLDMDLGEKTAPASEWLENPEVVAAIENRGIDMVAYPEKAGKMDPATIGVAEEMENPDSSLDRSGVSTSYKTFGSAEIMEVTQ